LTTDKINNNAIVLSKELEWFKVVLHTRIQFQFRQDMDYTSIYDIVPPHLDSYPSNYSVLVKTLELHSIERLIIILALLPHVAPNLLDSLLITNSDTNTPFTEYGGLKGQVHKGFLPTIETVFFLLAHNDLTLRFRVMGIFDRNSVLRKNNIIKLSKPKPNEPKWSSALDISEEYLTYLTTGELYKPDFSSNFPAKLITTPLEWSDLVLHDYVLEDVLEIQAWLEHQRTILDTWGMGKHIKPGYRALFYGPPGTGKTLTASLNGKAMNLDVYRIDLSQVVSKYIGETEKNMANIFDQAENKNWILFFDEADALFGRRTAGGDSKDRHANQEVAYLLQRVESFPGVVVLATNLKGNIDEAFARRFQAMIYFPMPSQEQRLRLWQAAFSTATPLAEDVDLITIARKYEVAGGAIINVARYCALSALRRGDTMIFRDDIIQGIAREYAKEGKTL